MLAAACSGLFLLLHVRVSCAGGLQADLVIALIIPVLFRGDWPRGTGCTFNNNSNNFREHEWNLSDDLEEDEGISRDGATLQLQI